MVIRHGQKIVLHTLEDTIERNSHNNRIICKIFDELAAAHYQKENSTGLDLRSAVRHKVDAYYTALLINNIAWKKVANNL